MAPQRHLLVTIHCLTFNQEAFIADCLEGFIRQRTSFDFEAIVHDDASTDGTADIIRRYAEKYPEVIKPICETENQYHKWNNSILHIMETLPRNGKYIAICEGDDYWTDPLKLQRQVDFLETHPDYGMCFTQALSIQGDKQQIIPLEHIAKDLRFEDLIMNNPIPAMTVVFDNALYCNYLDTVLPSSHRTWNTADYPIWLWCSLYSKIKFLPFVSGSYRFLSGSISHPEDYDKEMYFLNCKFDIKREYLSKNYKGNVSDTLISKVENQYYFKLFNIAFKYSRRQEAYDHYRQISHKRITTRCKYLYLKLSGKN